MKMQGNFFDPDDRQALCDWLVEPGRRWGGMFPNELLPPLNFAICGDRVYMGSVAFEEADARLRGRAPASSIVVQRAKVTHDDAGPTLTAELPAL